ncbi:MAG: class I SAM-dependent methyltransferase [Acidiferrobacterales bacterium]|nr:class I SAM-dependent methyltransferase [Acidiferrobacterales bacterium]
MAITDKNHQHIQAHFADRDTTKLYAVDATCGNGHDTLFLAKLGFKRVFAFDIQQHAIEQTHQRVKAASCSDVKLMQTGHETINKHIAHKVDCIVFNLGYLPHGDKTLATKQQTTLEALSQSLSLLNSAGLLSILCYPGHPEGAIETKAVEAWLNSIDTHSFIVRQVLATQPSIKAPILYLIDKI